MRRLSTRKRNRIILKDINRKTLILIGILSVFIIIIFLVFIFYIKNFIIKSKFENASAYTANLNEETVFSLNKIVLFSSATVKTNELKNSVWNLDISQFTDICIYLNNFPNDNTSKNVVKKLYIDNINVPKTEIGTPLLYQKAIQDFGKSSFDEKKIISDRIDYNIVSSNSAANYSNYEMLEDISNPIVFGYYNKDIKTNFLNSNPRLNYNGKILKEAKIPKISIENSISFDIHIINELDEEYICNINFEIPFEDDNSSIYEDGYITKELNNLDNYKFLRLK